MRPPVLPALTSLRFLLALYVLFFHNVSIFEGTGYLYQLLTKGYIAVSGFFVLSGFILSYNYSSREGFSLKKFYVARVARILPVYILSILIQLPVFFYFSRSVFYDQWSKEFFPTTVSTFFMIQTWNAEWLEKLNGPSWSISVEFFFYLLFPLSLRIIKKLKPLIQICLLLLLYVLIFYNIPAWVVGKVYEGFQVPINSAAHPITHLPVFISGALFANLYLDNKEEFQFRIRKNTMTFLATFLVSMSAAFLLLLFKNYPSFNNGFFLPFFLLLFLLSIEVGWVVKLMGAPVLIILGNASYGVYILQEPVKVWFNILHDKINQFYFIDYHLFIVSYFFVLLFISILIYNKVERPLNTYIRTKLS